MFEVEDWVEELIKKVIDTYGCTRDKATSEIKLNLYSL